MTEKDLATVCEEFPHLDFDHVYAEFVRVNTDKGTEKANLKWLRGFFKRHRPDKETPSAIESRTAELSSEDEEIRLARLPRLEWWTVKGDDVLKLGGKPMPQEKFGISQDDFLRIAKSMKTRSPENGKKFLRDLVGGKEWNYQDAIECDIICEVKDKDSKTAWEAVDYESEESKAKREEAERLEAEEEAKAAKAAAEAQRQAAIVGQVAEKIRKDREEAERKEREKADAIRRQRESEERQKREAELAEEEKEFNKKFNPAFSVIRSNGERETFTEATWTSLSLRFSKERFIDHLKQKRVSESTTNAVIAAIEEHGLNWWKIETQEEIAKRQKLETLFSEMKDSDHLRLIPNVEEAFVRCKSRDEFVEFLYDNIDDGSHVAQILDMIERHKLCGELVA